MNPGGHPRRARAAAILMLLGSLLLTGCITKLLGLDGEPEVAGENGSITLTKLDRIIYNFADRDVSLVSDAVEAFKRDSPTRQERVRAQHFKLDNGTAVYDIVTSPNTLGHLVDLYVLIHLQHLALVEEGKGPRIFGEKGAQRLAVVLGQLLSEVNQLAELAMKGPRKESLNKMIREWRQRHPDVEFVSGIRFGNLPELSGKSVLEIIPSFFDVLNPLDETSRSVDETRQLAERAFYFSKRLPQLLDWQAECALDDVLAKPEVHQALEDVTRVTEIVRQLPDRVVAERKEILAAWDSRHGEAVSMLKEIRETLAEARAAGNAFEQTFDALHRVVEPSGERDAAKPSKPFDITEYTAAAVEIGHMARDARCLLSESHDLLESPAWTSRREDVSRLARETVAHAERGTRSMVDHLAWRMAQVLGVFFGLLLLYKVILKRSP